MTRMGPRVEFWWWLEKRLGDLWQRLGKNRASYWMDIFPAWAYHHRKEAERRWTGKETTQFAGTSDRDSDKWRCP